MGILHSSPNRLGDAFENGLDTCQLYTDGEKMPASVVHAPVLEGQRCDVAVFHVPIEKREILTVVVVKNKTAVNPTSPVPGFTALLSLSVLPIPEETLVGLTERYYLSCGIFQATGPASLAPWPGQVTAQGLIVGIGDQVSRYTGIS